MAKLTGHQKALRRIKALNSPNAERRVEAALHAYGNLIQVEAQIAISSGAVSGKQHQPSQPGEAPHFDTGTLANGIETAKSGRLEVEVTSNAPYSVALEFGTSKMQARPFMAPAVATMRGRGEKLVAEAMRREIRKAK